MKNSNKISINLLIFVTIIHVLVYIGSIYVDIHDERGDTVRPTEIIQSGIDMDFYQKESNRMFNNGDQISGLISPPIFPLMIHVFNYNNSGSSIPLSLFYLVISIAMSLIWMRYFSMNKIGNYGLITYIFIPMPMWYMLNISTDLLFAFLFSIFFISYFNTEKLKFNTSIWIAALILMVLTRANGFTIVAFVFLDYLFIKNNIPKASLAILVSLCLSIFIYYDLYDHFLQFIRSSLDLGYYGIPYNQYISGLNIFTLETADKVISWFLLVIAKILYYLGVRPSYGDTALSLVIIKSIFGLFFLIGLFGMFYYKAYRVLLLLLIFSLPVLMGASQDRYNLPIQPLLFYYGWILLNRCKDADKRLRY